MTHSHTFQDLIRLGLSQLPREALLRLQEKINVGHPLLLDGAVISKDGTYG